MFVVVLHVRVGGGVWLLWRGSFYLLRLGRCRHLCTGLLFFAHFDNRALCRVFLRREDVTEAEAGSHQES